MMRVMEAIRGERLGVCAFVSLVMLCIGVCAAAEEEADVPPVAIDEARDIAVDDAAWPAVLDLATIERLVLWGNPSLEAARARLEQAEYRVRQARSSYFPQVDATFDASRTWLSDNQVESLAQQNAGQGGGIASLAQFSAFGGGLSDPAALARQALRSTLINRAFGTLFQPEISDTSDVYSSSIMASWTLFDGLAREYSVKAARFAEMETEAAYREAQRLLLSLAATSYYQAQFAEDLIAIAQADLVFNESQLAEARARREAGTGSLSDVLNFEVRLNSTRNALISAEEALDVSLITLAEVLGVADTRVPENIALAPMDEVGAEELSPPDAEEYVTLAYAHRPDLQQLEAAVDRGDANVKIQRGTYYPRVTARASRNGVRTDNAGFDGDDFDSHVGVNVSYNLYAGGARRARIGEARALKSEAEWTLRNAEVTAAADVRRAVAELVSAQKQLALEQANAENVRRNRDLVEKGYEAGQESLVRLNEAQRDLNQAQARWATARASLRMAWYGLRTAAGLTVADLAEAGSAVEGAGTVEDN